MADQKRTSRAQTGFTFIEILVALLIMSFMFSTLYFLFVSVYRYYAVNSRESDVLNKCRNALIPIGREVEDAQKPSDSTDPVVVKSYNQTTGVATLQDSTVGGNELDIYTDINNDKKPELVVYVLVNSMLKRAVFQPDNAATAVYPFTYNNYKTLKTDPTKYTSIMPGVTVTNTLIFTQYSPISIATLATYWNVDHNTWEVVVHFILDCSVSPLSRQFEEITTFSVRRRVKTS